MSQLVKPKTKPSGGAQFSSNHSGLVVMEDGTEIRPPGGPSTVNPIEKVKAWTKDNAVQPEGGVVAGKLLQDIVMVNNDGAWREELEVELRHDDIFV